MTSPELVGRPAFFALAPVPNPPSAAEAPALPFEPFAWKSTRELRAKLAKRQLRENRQRQRLSLPLAVVGLLAPIGAVVTTSNAGEAALTESVPATIRRADDSGAVDINAAARESHSQDAKPIKPKDR